MNQLILHDLSIIVASKPGPTWGFADSLVGQSDPAGVPLTVQSPLSIIYDVRACGAFGVWGPPQLGTFNTEKT